MLFDWPVSGAVPQGGFKAWATAGLPVKEADDYEVTTLDTLNDTIERLRCPPGGGL